MKLVRYGRLGEERPGALDARGQLRDLSGIVSDIAGDALSDETLEVIRYELNGLPIVDGNPRLGACVSGFTKFMCIGLNYSDHAEEVHAVPPEHPVLFLKANSAVSGSQDNLVLPRGSTTTDWEVELGVVIGKTAHHVSEAEALDYVAGYCIVNDVSERTLQMKLSGQWTKGKSCDGFGPIGPWLVTRDEVPDPQTLDLYCDVNGRRMQEGNTRTMIFPVAECIAHLSTLFTLHPGDIISTGTPPGVGHGKKPDPIYLRPGDVMELGITGLGRQRQIVVAG